MEWSQQMCLHYDKHYDHITYKRDDTNINTNKLITHFGVTFQDDLAN